MKTKSPERFLQIGLFKAEGSGFVSLANRRGGQQ
jgi:hypothetical protein